ncbi:MAG: 4-alpha-glucanotransferase [Thiobacillaceae bacterium]
MTPLPARDMGRRAGILLHPTSLPSACLNHDAERFIDWLASAGFGIWQILPLGPTQDGGSPYQSPSAHALNPALLDIDVHHARLAFTRSDDLQQREAYAEFLRTQVDWLPDYALFMALRQQYNQPWYEWPAPIRLREPDALHKAHHELNAQIEHILFEQFLLYSRWQALREKARKKDILLFGDMPIFVAHDSADVWVHPEYFSLDSDGALIEVAGVPPDYFSATGQRWGNPLYRWDRLEQDGFAWWISRIKTQLSLYDWVRIDHFRGLAAAWHIPASEPTAQGGRWVKAPGDRMLQALLDHFGPLPLVAEDLGLITDDVVELKHQFGLPGMTVLQFGFEGDANNPHRFGNHQPHSVIYTGTHDNDTTLGWWQSLPADRQTQILIELDQSASDMPWPMIEAVLASPCAWAMLPMQDVLQLDSRARMNTPGTNEGNWQWRLDRNALTHGLSHHLRSLIQHFGRLPVASD